MHATRSVEVNFSRPGEACQERVVGLWDAAQRTADVIVFTITDNQLLCVLAEMCVDRVQGDQ